MMRSADCIEWGLAGRAIPGESESGDLHVVTPFPGGVLVGVIDALGHGPEAATVAQAARATLEMHASESVTQLVERCHQSLRYTRGAVMTIVSFDAAIDTMAWLGVGNVDALLLRADALAARRRETVVPRGGVVGHNLPRSHPATLSIAAGDILILATDGISTQFADGRYHGTPQQIADEILERHGKTTDDTLVLVARYEGLQR